MSRRLTMLAAVVLAAVTVGGCTSGKIREANDYVKAVNGARVSFAAASDKLVEEIAPDSDASHNRRAIGRYSTVVGAFVGQLRAIKPPARVRSLHARLVTVTETFGRQLRRAGAAITSGSAARILDGQQELASASSRFASAVNSTIAAINRQLKG